MPSRTLSSPKPGLSILRRLGPVALSLGLFLSLAATGAGPLRAAIPPVTLAGGDYYPFGLPYLGSPSTPISVAPTFADIDGDGDPDAFLLTASPQIRYCENTGTATAPAFAAPVPFPFGLPDIGYSSLTFADIDADSDLDAIAVTGAFNVVFLRNVGTATAPSFTSPASLGLNSGANPNFRAISVSLGDLDGDGDLDALVGNDDGHLLYCQNTGTPASATFAQPVFDPFGLQVPDHDAVPVIGDLDRDGDLDVLVGTYYGTVDHPFTSFYFQNVGTPTAPAFAAPVPSVGGYYYTHPAFVDIDGDGDLDVFVGDSIAHLIVWYSTASGWYFTVTPCRALDTRQSSALASGTETRLLLQGHCGIPPTARAVAMNLTVTEGSSGGYLQAYQSGTPLPNASVVNFAAGGTRANSAILELGTRYGQCSDCKGQLSLVPFLDDGGAVEVIVDVVGYFE